MNWLHRGCLRDKEDALERKRTAYEGHINSLQDSVRYWQGAAAALQAKRPPRCSKCKKFKKRDAECRCARRMPIGRIFHAS
jgi:hypothetical protein